MTCPHKSLLPHPTPFEADLEAHAAQKYCQLDADIIRRIHDPAACPVELLPWLAYALSVDVWNDKWPEATKRAVCANSLAVHRVKGTHGGVVDALALLGIRAEIVYWHEMEPQGESGTMDVTLWVNDNILPNATVLLGAELTRDVLEQLERSKRASIHYTFALAVEMTTGFSVGYSAGESSTLTRVEAQQRQANINARPFPLSLAYSAGESSTLTRVEAQQRQANINARTAPYLIGFSAGETVTITRMEMRI